jgi:hypothetical protein
MTVYKEGFISVPIGAEASNLNHSLIEVEITFSTHEIFVPLFPSIYCCVRVGTSFRRSFHF